jgi:hypothetical protein
MQNRRVLLHGNLSRCEGDMTDIVGRYLALLCGKPAGSPVKGSNGIRPDGIVHIMKTLHRRLRQIRVPLVFLERG